MRRKSKFEDKKYHFKNISQFLTRTSFRDMNISHIFIRISFKDQNIIGRQNIIERQKYQGLEARLGSAIQQLRQREEEMEGVSAFFLVLLCFFASFCLFCLICLFRLIRVRVLTQSRPDAR